MDRLELILVDFAQQHWLDAFSTRHYGPDLRQCEQLDDDIHDPLSELVHGRLKLIVQGVGIPHPLIFPKPFQEPFPVIVSWQPVPADAAQAGDTSSSPECALEELAGPVCAHLNDGHSYGVDQGYEEIVHLLSPARPGLVEVLNLIDDQYSKSMKIGDLAHAGQQALGTQFLTTMAAAVMSAQHPVHLV